MPAIINISVTSDLPEVGARLTAADRAFPVLTKEGISRLAPRLQTQAVTYIKDATPVGVTSPHLFETTEGETIYAGDGFEVDIHQTKVVGAKGWVLAPLLILGHRIVTRSGIDTGRSTTPNDYVSPALDPLVADLDGLLIVEGTKILESVVAVMA
jgi:hypothetical protein